MLPLWEYYDDDVRDRARHWLDFLGCAHLRERSIRACSQGERARVRLARALVANPTLLILDEAFAGLDMPARDELLHALEAPAGRTHHRTRHPPHVEEVPRSATHVLMLRAGQVTSAGPIADTFTQEALSQCLDRPIQLTDIDGRWSAQLQRI